jgi:Cdc6-like AAA superfamily ATPase
MANGPVDIQEGPADSLRTPASWRNVPSHCLRREDPLVSLVMCYTARSDTHTHTHTQELRVKNEEIWEICAKIKQFKECKLAELSNLKLNVEGEEEKNILRSRFGYASQAGTSSETQGELPGEVFETAKTFFDWIVARSRAGLACLTGPPASGKTVTMQQIVPEICIFQEELKTVILELYEYGRVFMCIDGLDEAAARWAR